MSRPKVIFLPWVKVDPSTTERTPKLLHLISQWYEAVPVRPGRFNRMVYDQGVNRMLRYMLFALDEIDTFLSTLRTAKREDAELIFAEGTYFSLAGGLAARIRRIPMVWDNHANIKDFSAALGKSKLFYRGNLLLERILFPFLLGGAGGIGAGKAGVPGAWLRRGPLHRGADMRRPHIA